MPGNGREEAIMANSEVQPGQVSDGHGLVLFAPKGTIADRAHPTVEELTGDDVIDLTYALTADGFNHTVTTADVTVSRYTLDQELTLEGKETHTLVLKYPYTNTDSDVARTTLTPGIEGDIIHRLGYANSEEIAEDQILDVIPVRAGKSVKDAPAANTELTRTQKLSITGKVELDATVVDSGN